MKDLYEIVDGSIDTTHKVKEPKPDGDRIYDISKIDFERLRRSFLDQSERYYGYNRSKHAVEKKLASS